MRNKSNNNQVPALNKGSGVGSGVDDERRNQSELAFRIKALRKKVDLTQRDLAKIVGVSVNSVQKWESGTKPNSKHIPKLSEALKCSTDFLIFGGEPEILADEVIRYPGQEIPGNTPLLNKVKSDELEYNRGGGHKGKSIEELFGVEEGSPMSQAVRLLLKIYDSQNEYLIRAISYNLQAFGHMVDQSRREKEADDKIEDLRAQLESIQKELSDRGLIVIERRKGAERRKEPEPKPPVQERRHLNDRRK
jgi:transcriptional regulator with XRE-family HTH domain